MCMDELAKKGGGDLAYTPEVQHRVMTILQRKFEEDLGGDIFALPNYAPYDDQQMANFYGIDTSKTENLQSRKETYDEQRARLVQETVAEFEPEMAGLATTMQQYRLEDWARHGVADENIYTHTNPDATLLRNYKGGWSSLDVPISTSEKSNVVDMYQATPEYTFPRRHPGWEVDRRGGLWNSLK